MGEDDFLEAQYEDRFYVEDEPYSIYDYLNEGDEEE